MKIRISGADQIIKDDIIDDLREDIPTYNEYIENNEFDETIEEESDADFQYNNTGIYFRNGIEIIFNTDNTDISVESIKFPNDISFAFKCDEFGNLLYYNQVGETEK